MAFTNKKLFFDIETIPCDEEIKNIYFELLKTKNARKGITEMSEQEWLEIHRNTSLDGAWGRICCIAVIKEDGQKSKQIFQGSEKELLQEFWKAADDVNLFIGHNVFDFDFPFIYKRSIIHGVKPRFDLNFARYRSFPIYDTMCEWEKWNMSRKASLDMLAKLFGFESSKTDMDGSQVWGAYQEGRIEDICNYCMKDVEVTRKVYYRMIMEQDPFPEPLPAIISAGSVQAVPALQSASQDDLPF